MKYLFSLVVKPISSFSVFGHGMIFQKTVFGTQVWFFWATRTLIACTFYFVLNCETTHSAFSLFFNSIDKMLGVFQSCQHRCIGWTSRLFFFENRLFAGFGCFISDSLVSLSAFEICFQLSRRGFCVGLPGAVA